MKQRILVETGASFGHENAMSNVIMPFIYSIKERYDVDVFCTVGDGTLPLVDTVNGVTVFQSKTFSSGFKGQFQHFKSLIQKIRYLDQRTVTRRRWIWLVKAAIFLASLPNNACFYHFMNLGEKKHWYNTLDKLVTERHYDAVISFSSPIQNQTDCLRAQRQGIFKDSNTVWIAYFLDPFASYCGNLSKPDADVRWQYEEEIYQSSNYVFTTPELKKNNSQYVTGKYDGKVTAIPYANLTFQNIQSCPTEVVFNSSKINCLYTGSLFDTDIRNPYTFFRYASECPDDVEIYIISYLSSPAVERYKNFLLSNNKNVHWVSRLPLKQCLSLIQSADILINIGNECSNQVPSKIFDYIAAAKPIVHFYSIKDDPCFAYLNNYPCKLYLQNVPSQSSIQSQAMFDFCRSAKKTPIDINMIKNLYQQLNSKHSVAIFSSKLESILSDHTNRTR
jgi:hypothetical protein